MAHFSLTLRIAALTVLAVAPLTGAGTPARASKFYEDALARYERQDAAGTIIQLKNALQHDPQLLAAYVLLGRAQLDQGDSAAAEDAFTRALKLGADRAELAVLMARALLDQGKAQALLERFPPESAPPAARAELMTLRAKAHLATGDATTALRAFDDALAIEPGYPPALHGKIGLLFQQRKREDAQRLLDRALAAAPGDPGLLTLKGSLAYAAGDVKSALAAYGSVLSANPDLVDPRIARASLYLDLRRDADAEGDIAHLLKVSPKEPRALYLSSVQLARRGDEAGVRAALQRLAEGLDRVPKEVLQRRAPDLLLLGGLAHHGLQQQEKARSYLDGLLKANPNHMGGRKLLAAILIAAGEHQQAIPLLEGVVRAAPGDPQALALLGSAHMGRKQYARATRYLEDALKASSEAPRVQASLGLSLLGAGQTDLAIEQLQRAFDRDPKQARAGVALTVLYLRQGKTPQALGAAEALAKQAPADPVALNLLGVARAAAGDRKGARTAYTQATAASVAFMPARLNLAKLDAVEGDFDGARRRFDEILKANPKNTQAMFELAELEVRAGRRGDALRWLEKIRVMNSRHILAATRHSELLLLDGQPDKALEAAKEAEAAAPESLDALGAVARAYIAIGNDKLAQNTLGRMTRLAGFDPEWQTRIARFQLGARHPQGALYSLDKALSGAPDYLPALVLMTEVELESGELAKADQRARSLVKRVPSQSVGYRLVGDVAMARGNYADAITSYRAALAREETTDGAVRLYRAFFQAGSAAKAVEFMEGWTRKHPNDTMGMQALAEGRLRTGNLAAARTTYEQLLKLQGEDPIVLNNLANILWRQGDARALEYAERAQRAAPKDAGIQDTLGWVLVQSGQTDAGLRHLREARLRDPQSLEIRYHLGAALAAAGRKDEARAELDHALSAGRPFEGRDQAHALRRELGTTGERPGGR
jgi:putative PEP-CTERM system TPR-repeat lipoprotein